MEVLFKLQPRFLLLSIFIIMASRTFFAFALIAALACIAMAAPRTTTAASSKTKSSAGTAMTNGNYDMNGLPSNIFPDYSKFVLADNDNLNNGLLYLQDQGSKAKMPN